MKLSDKIIHERWKDSKLYFSEAKAEITEVNLRQLTIASIVTLFVIAGFIVVTPYIFPNWSVSAPYYVFVAMMLAIAGITLAYRRHSHHGYRMTMFLCILFDVLFMLGCMLIDIIPFPDSIATYFPVTIVFIASLFVVPYTSQLFLLTMIEAVYLLWLHLYKTPYIASVDSYQSVVGYFCSVFITIVIINLRVEDGLNKHRYMKQGTTDSLTLLKNRAECETLIKNILCRRTPDDPVCVMLMLDVDHFKQINDSLGHQAGDEVLGKVGEILRSEFREQDIIGRIGGDEFMILLPDIADEKNVPLIAARVAECISRISETLQGVRIGCSSGAVILSGRAEYEEMYRLADEALYEAKHCGGGRCVIRRIGSQSA